MPSERSQLLRQCVSHDSIYIKVSNKQNKSTVAEVTIMATTGNGGEGGVTDWKGVREVSE